jgi:hypothetical protein
LATCFCSVNLFRGSFRVFRHSAMRSIFYDKFRMSSRGMRFKISDFYLCHRSHLSLSSHLSCRDDYISRDDGKRDLRCTFCHLRPLRRKNSFTSPHGVRVLAFVVTYMCLHCHSRDAVIHPEVCTDNLELHTEKWRSFAWQLF